MNIPKLQRPLLVFTLFSAAITGLIAALMAFPAWFRIHSFSPFVLPAVNASLNAVNALLLLVALAAAKRRRIVLHRRLMLVALVLSALFLVSYLLYHAQGIEVRFGDSNGDGLLSLAEKEAAGWLRFVYYGILLSHILMSAVILPFILFAYYLGLRSQIEEHRRMVRYVWPVWFYVCLSGVLVYLFIHPYYSYISY